MVNSQETSFVQSDEQRNGKQEVRVLVPRLKKTSERERAELQSLLDLTDWRGLHSAFTPNQLQHPREWAPSDHSSGSYFRVKTSVTIQTATSLPQLESLRRFVVNSLLVETSSTQVYTESMPAPVTSRGKMTIAVKARSIHRARELGVELQEWSSSSLREVLLTCGVWKEGMRTLGPDKPRIVTLWGDPLENGSLPLRTNQEESSNTFVTWIRALFDKHRILQRYNILSFLDSRSDRG
jgi:hypothetical protein